MRRKLAALCVAAAVGALVVAALSLAATQATVWTAALSAGQEFPKQVVKTPAAHGLFKGTLTGKTLKWRLTFSKLSGPASQPRLHSQ